MYTYVSAYIHYVSACINLYVRLVFTPVPYLSQPSTFPLPDSWHAIRSNIIYDMQSGPIIHCRKIQNLVSFFPFSAFLNYLTGPNIPYQAGRKFTEQQTVSQSLDTETTTPTQPTRTQLLGQPPAKHRCRKTKPRECIKYSTSKNLDHLTTIITVLHQFSVFSIKYTSLISTRKYLISTCLF